MKFTDIHQFERQVKMDNSKHWDTSDRWRSGLCEDGMQYWDLDVGMFRVSITREPYKEALYIVNLEDRDGHGHSTLTYPDGFTSLFEAEAFGIEWALGWVQSWIDELLKLRGEPEKAMVESPGNKANTRSNKKKTGQYTETRPDGTKTEEWYKNDLLHREDGPAFVAGEINSHYTETCPDGTRIETWYQNDKKHRVGGPALVEVYPDGTKVEYWYQNGRLHREDGPAIVHTQLDSYKHEAWYKNGQFHREDGPAYVVIYPNDTKTETWYKNGKIHREDGPAYVYIKPNGSKTEKWYKNDLLHREGGPACVTVRPNGTRIEEWYQNGQPHREDGPADVEVYPDGTKVEYWYKNGIRIDAPSKTD